MADLPIDKPPGLIAQEEMPSDDDLGFNDPQNIHYINMESEGIGERFRDQIRDLERMLELTHQIATIHAGIQVKRRIKEGNLPNDSSDDSRWKRSKYRAKVMEVYFQDGIYPWLVSPGSHAADHEINVEKSRFHWELLTKMLSGIVIPRPVSTSLEAIFKGIGDTIKEASYEDGGRTFSSMLQVITFDEIRDEVRASFRNITYTLTQDMYSAVKTKSTQSKITARFSFRQSDLSFNEGTWVGMQPEVEKFISGTGIGNIRDLPSVPV